MTAWDWISKNAWSIVITLSGIAATFSLYGYRLDQVEKEEVTLQSQITIINAQQVQTQVSLAQIQVDLSYIKASLDKRFSN